MCGESKIRVGKARYVWGKQDTCGESKIRVEFVNCGDKCGRIRVEFVNCGDKCGRILCGICELW